MCSFFYVPFGTCPHCFVTPAPSPPSHHDLPWHCSLSVHSDDKQSHVCASGRGQGDGFLPKQQEPQEVHLNLSQDPLKRVVPLGFFNSFISTTALVKGRGQGHRRLTRRTFGLPEAFQTSHQLDMV